jgi:hypothetical protein
LRLILLTALTMIAFAANSVLGRMAIGPGPFGSGGLPLIDPASYSAIRLGSGAVMLVLLVAVTRTGAGRSPRLRSGSWASAFALFAYAVAFSYAYVALDTGVGALILFACVQATMIGWSLKEGDRPSPLEWLGLIVAFGSLHLAGLAGLVRPGSAGGSGHGGVRDRLGRLFAAGGRGLPDPLKATADNFTALGRLPHSALRRGAGGAGLPVHASGQRRDAGHCLRRGHLRPRLRALVPACSSRSAAPQGAIVQLTVPVIAAIGGTLFLAEGWTLRLVAFIGADSGRCGAGDSSPSKGGFEVRPVSCRLRSL